MYDDPTEEIGVSLPTSVNERASDTTNKITGPSFIDKAPSIDWSTDYNLYNCFKMWKQRCELLPGRWRKLNKKSNASIYYTGRENTEPNFKQLGHVRGWAKKAGKLLDEIRTFCQATLKWVNSNVGDSQPPTRYPLSGRIYCEIENPCEGSLLYDTAQWSIHERFPCARNELWPFAKGLLQSRKCFHLQGSSWYGKVSRVGRQPASANQYPKCTRSMFLKDIKAKETSDQLLILAQVNCTPAETVADVPTLESSAQRRMLQVTTARK